MQISGAINFNLGDNMSDKKAKYIVVSEDDLITFTDRVNDYLYKGYVLRGDLVVFGVGGCTEVGDILGFTTYSQVLIPEENQS